MESQRRPRIDIGPSIREALASARAVVALESAVFTHGLPKAEAPACFREVEDAVRSVGALPATCGVLAGLPRIGMSESDLAEMLHAPAVKATPATLAHVVATSGSAGTTLGATMMLAAVAGVRVASTGGIGGVHRTGRWDVSGDVACLARLPMVVVCSGPKAILDLAATLEVLETAGVTILGYRTDELPGFYTASTGLPVPCRVECPEEVAEAWVAARAVGSSASVLVVTPPPPDLAFDAETVSRAVEETLHEAGSGPSATPTHLSLLQRRLGPRSLALNRALLAHNARLAGLVAIALASAYSR